MISQRPRKVRIVLVTVIGISFLGMLLSSAVWNSCGIKHVGILNDIEKYENTLDPEFCESITFRILDYNEDCDADIEILDCG